VDLIERLLGVDVAALDRGESSALAFRVDG
jgi:hypothetical protein